MNRSRERILSVMPTFRCTAQCEHCGTLSHPKAGGGALSLAEMCGVIDQGCAAGYRIIVFTGGEPTLAGDDLLAAMRHAALKGMLVRMVTNSWWASDAQAAQARVDRFVHAGLSQVTLSTGDQHGRFVPVEHVLHAALAAIERAMDVAIVVECVRERTITRMSIESHPQYQRLRERYPHAGLAVTESIWSPLSYVQIGRYSAGHAVNRENLEKCTGCDSILNTTTIHPDGKIFACCGLGMRLIDELSPGCLGELTIAQADALAATDPFKQRLAKEGPEKLLAEAAAIDPSIEWENMYAHRCQACIRIYKDPKVRFALGLQRA